MRGDSGSSPDCVPIGAVRQAVMRSTFLVAAEAFGCLAARRWRDDAGAWAVVAPWAFVHRAHLDRWTPRRLRPVLGAGRAVRATIAARTALDMAGATVVQEHRAWLGPNVESLERPLEVPWTARRGFLFRAWRRAEWGRLVNRHADFAAAGAPDMAATRRELGRPRAPDRAAAFRTVVHGEAVPQAVAVHWTGIEFCPHCRGAAGTLRHKMWKCPRWAAERAAAGAHLGPPVGCPQVV